MKSSLLFLIMSSSSILGSSSVTHQSAQPSEAFHMAAIKKQWDINKKAITESLLKDSASPWRTLHRLPSSKIGSCVLYNHPVVEYILRHVELPVPQELKRTVISRAGDTIIRRPLMSPVLEPLFTVGNALGLFSSNVYDKVTGKYVAQLSAHGGLRISTFSRDSSRIAALSRDNVVHLFDAKNGTSLARVPTTHPLSITEEFFSEALDKIVIISSSGNSMQVWDVSTGRCLLTGPCTKYNAWNFGSVGAFNKEGTLIALIEADTRTVTIWDIAGSQGNHICTITNGSEVSDVCFNKHSDKVAIALADGTTQLCDPWLGTELMRLSGHHNTVTAVLFNEPQAEDKELLVTTSFDGTAKIWDPDTGVCRTTLEDHTKPATYACFNNRGNLIVTTADEGIVRVFDQATGRCIFSREAYSSFPRPRTFRAHFDESGRKIIATCQGLTKIWDIDKLITWYDCFFIKEDTFTLPQAYLLTKIFEKIEERKLMGSKEIVFDFTGCAHLEEEYDALLKHYIENGTYSIAMRKELHRILAPFIKRNPTILRRIVTAGQEAITTLADMIPANG
jgi:WD40 repeat protein